MTAPAPGEPHPLSVLFVCLGNHCRSPAAHAVAVAMARRRSTEHITFDSAGTSSEHADRLPHPLGSAEGGRRGYAVNHRGRRIHPDDFGRVDLIIAMNASNIDDLRRLGAAIDERTGFYRTIEPTQVQLFRRWDPFAMPGNEDLADPWGCGPAAYADMYDVIERTMPALLEHLESLVAESRSFRAD